MKEIAIIGAGIGGMTAAYELSKAGQQVTIFEADKQVGGLASGFKEPHWDWWVEKYYHHWFATDQYVLTLIDELGWKNQVIFNRPYTVMYYKDNFYPFDSISKAILFPGLGWGINKVRFGLVGLYLRVFTNNWQTLEKHTVDKWLRKWAGSEVYEMMWEPLLIGKFGERYAKQVNMAWMWARLKARTTQLGTFQGGFQGFAEKFATRLREMGVQIHLNTAVESVTTYPGRGLNLSVSSGVKRYDQCLATTSPGLLSKIVPDLPDTYLAGLKELKSMGAVAMILALKHRLSEEGYYWFNLPKSAGFPFLALVEHTNFVPPEYFGGEHIIYIGDYLESDHEYFTLSQDDLLKQFLPALSRFNPKFNPEWILKTWLFRTNYAQPVPLVNHSKNIPTIQTPLPDLYFASMSQVYPWDRGTNFAVEIAQKATRMMLEKTEF